MGEFMDKYFNMQEYMKPGLMTPVRTIPPSLSLLAGPTSASAIKTPLNPDVITKPSVDEPTDMPGGFGKAYYSALTSPYTVPKTPGVEDIPGSVSAAYNHFANPTASVDGQTVPVARGLTTDSDGNMVAKSPSKTLGVLAGSLAGLGKIGEVMNTNTGSKILAGLAGNPYLGQGYLNNANEARQREIANNSMAFQGNQDKLKQQGEDVRAMRAEKADKDKAKMQMVTEIQKTIMQIQAQAAQQGRELNSQEQRQVSELTQKAKEFNATEQSKADASNRSWLGSILGKPLGMSQVKPQKVTAPSTGASWRVIEK